ncbi:hypothetical protein BGZ80_009676, partial [Entomortierella chlamydospora]
LLATEDGAIHDSEYDDAESIDMTEDNEIQPTRNKEVSIARKRNQEENHDIKVWKRLRGDLSSMMFRAVIGSMQADVYKVSGHGMVLGADAFSFLQESLTAELKITKMEPPKDAHNKKLVVGVRNHNYLVTAALYDETAVVEPNRCASFPVNGRTRIYIRKERQEANLLDGGLAQVRSNFGHPARAGEAGQGPTLLLEGLGSTTETSTTQGQLLQSLRKLVAKEGTLCVSTSADAEEILSKLASSFSGMISDKNKTVMDNIASDD